MFENFRSHCKHDKLKFGRVIFLFRYKRKSVVLPPYEHEYRHGFQHMCPK